MRTASVLGLAVAMCLACFTSPLRTSRAQGASAKELAGLWEAKKRFGPQVRGTLFIRQTGDNWQAEIAGRFAPVRLERDSVSFELPDGQGKFRGRFDAR